MVFSCRTEEQNLFLSNVSHTLVQVPKVPQHHGSFSGNIVAYLDKFSVFVFFVLLQLKISPVGNTAGKYFNGTEAVKGKQLFLNFLLYF